MISRFNKEFKFLGIVKNRVTFLLEYSRANHKYDGYAQEGSYSVQPKSSITNKHESE